MKGWSIFSWLRGHPVSWVWVFFSSSNSGNWEWRSQFNINNSHTVSVDWHVVWDTCRRKNQDMEQKRNCPRAVSLELWKLSFLLKKSHKKRHVWKPPNSTFLRIHPWKFQVILFTAKYRGSDLILCLQSYSRLRNLPLFLWDTVYQSNNNLKKIKKMLCLFFFFSIPQLKRKSMDGVASKPPIMNP